MVDESFIPRMDIKMPKDYDFSIRNVDWKKYQPFYVLRTDAVWEKSKLYQYFYSSYKAPLYFNKDSYFIFSDFYMYKYVLHQFKGPVTYDEIGESTKNHHKVGLYNRNTPGAIFTHDQQYVKNKPRRTSQYLGDWSKEMTLLCMIKFFNWMRCNEKSEYKLTTTGVNDENFIKYECFEELNELKEFCINYHFRIMFECYYFRYFNDDLKFPSTQRIFRVPTYDRKPINAKKLYY